jgi:DNA-binding NtrC family response regulator
MSPAPLDVLVVDDDLFILELVLDVLQEEGYTVRGVSSAVEALSVLQQTPPRLLITDLRMPNMSGEELMQSVRTMGLTTLPIVAMSAHQVVDTPMIPETTAFLAKPFEIMSLVGLVARLLV